MTLPFTQFRNYANTLFLEKILYPYNTDIQKAFPNMIPKIHTFRLGARWKAGIKIHMVYNNRKKNRLEFNIDIPELQFCQGEQAAIIHLSKTGTLTISICDTPDQFPMIRRDLTPSENLLFAVNDGFNSIEEMIEWFFPAGKIPVHPGGVSLVGQIVHWTDFKY